MLKQLSRFLGFPTGPAGVDKPAFTSPLPAPTRALAPTVYCPSQRVAQCLRHRRATERAR